MNTSTAKQPNVAAINLPNSADPMPEGSDGGQVCIANINAKGRRRRLNIGIGAFIFGLVVLAIMMATGVPHIWRLALFFVFAGAATSYFEARDKTCVMLAAQNLFEVGEDYGTFGKVKDDAVKAQIRRQAIRLQIKAILAGIALTLIALFLVP